jgi:hypothetical protein
MIIIYFTPLIPPRNSGINSNERNMYGIRPSVLARGREVCPGWEREREKERMDEYFQ